MTDRPDVLIVGAGLSGGLLALALAARRPETRVTVIDAAPQASGRETWSWFDTDLGPDETALVADLPAHRWPRYDVAFPAFARTLETPYRSLASADFAQALETRLGARLMRGRRAADLSARSVTLEDGERIEAGAVIDARGAQATSHLSCGWQVFAGVELAFEAPPDRVTPMIMDARGAQDDAYHFVYVLPFAPDRALVEATAYAGQRGYDLDKLRTRALDYARAQGWRTRAIVREEQGRLPIALDGDIAALWDASPAPLAGIRAGLFHPATGYSFAEAARLATFVAGLPDLSAAPLRAAMRAHALARWKAHAFTRALNRMLFIAAAPAARRRVLERFYALPQDLIERFYAGRSTFGDKARLVSGRPPVGILPALQALQRRHPIGDLA